MLAQDCKDTDVRPGWDQAVSWETTGVNEIRRSGAASRGSGGKTETL